MEIVTQAAMVGALDYSLVYMLGGGGFVGAIVIYIIARLMGR